MQSGPIQWVQFILTAEGEAWTRSCSLSFGLGLSLQLAEPENSGYVAMNQFHKLGFRVKTRWQSSQWDLLASWIESP